MSSDIEKSILLGLGTVRVRVRVGVGVGVKFGVRVRDHLAGVHIVFRVEDVSKH